MSNKKTEDLDAAQDNAAGSSSDTPSYWGNFKLETQKYSKDESEESDEDEEEELVEEELDSNDSEEEEEEEEELEEDDDAPVAKNKGENFGSIMQKLVADDVLSIIDEEKEYEASQGGFQDLIKDHVQAEVTKELSRARESYSEPVRDILNFFEQNPNADIEEFIERQNEPDYANVDETNSEFQAFLVADHMEAMGYDEADITSTIRSYQKDGTLSKHAKIAKNKLAGMQVEYRQAQEKAKEIQTQKANEQRLQEANDFQLRVMKIDKLRGYDLSKKEKEELLDYITKPVDKSGKTKLMMDETEEDDLFYALLKMKKMNFEDLARKAQTKNVIKLKRDLDKQTDRNAGKRSSVYGESSDEDDGKPKKLNLKWNMSSGRD